MSCEIVGVAIENMFTCLNVTIYSYAMKTIRYHMSCTGDRMSCQFSILMQKCFDCICNFMYQYVEYICFDFDYEIYAHSPLSHITLLSIRFKCSVRKSTIVETFQRVIIYRLAMDVVIIFFFSNSSFASSLHISFFEFQCTKSMSKQN